MATATSKRAGNIGSTRIMRQVGGLSGQDHRRAGVILAGHSFQATFWWSVAFTAPGGAPRDYAAPPRSGPGAVPGGGIRGGIRGGRWSARPVTFSRRPGDGTATGQQASAQTVRPG
jgi:hypothetical protein